MVIDSILSVKITESVLYYESILFNLWLQKNYERNSNNVIFQ